ncbi:hypothetical protein BJP36_23150 [Moorena producens JHB]|uniref:Uncharacterized protein n=1 Tax=Moorena producens (strain JHB) TaxID=1454205 RepID=A0A1D9G400_MOOP1|nr:hypothetical protein [Moorena producens]AOY82372.1 hypothetical protein BJP36_23150 [Moorena producens JHB]
MGNRESGTGNREQGTGSRSKSVVNKVILSDAPKEPLRERIPEYLKLFRLFLTPDSRLPTPDSRFPIPDSPTQLVAGKLPPAMQRGLGGFPHERLHQEMK